MRLAVFPRVFALAGFLAVVAAPAAAADDALSPLMRAQLNARPAHPHALSPMHATPCVDGMAGGYPCSNIDLLAFVPVADFSASSTNSLWGWTDSQTGTEYALVGADNSTAFFDLTEADHPRYLGRLPTHTGSSIWRDVRVYADHAFIVSDNNGAHGMQVFDLTQLRGVTVPVDFTETAFYGGFGRGHTISINEDTGFASIAGSDFTCPGDSHTGGLYMIDIHTPANPTFAGCVHDAGYTHEAQCWTYNGPDAAHVGRDICFDSNGSSGKVNIVDVTDRSTPATLASIGYTGSAYTHQGWLTEDQRYFLMDDELDETSSTPHNAYTYVFDVSDLDAPFLVGHHEHPLSVIDHNLYVHGQYVYQSDYEAGVRILRIDNLSQAEMTEVAFFDVFPSSNHAQFNGSWNNYLFPGSGNIIATSIDEGFFVLQPHLCAAPAAPSGLNATPNGDHRIDLAWSGSSPGDSFRVERAQGGCQGTFQTIADSLAHESYSDIDASGQVNYGYRVIERDATGFCASEASTCVEAETTGTCTAAPIFAGISGAVNAGTSECRVDLSWNDASPACGGPANYSVYRSDDAAFVPGDDNRIALGWTGTNYSDNTPASLVPQYYVVHAVDGANGAEESNLIRLSATPSGPPTDGTFASGAEPGDPLLDTDAAGDTRRPDQVEHAGWHPSTARVHTGTQSFWSTAANNLCVTLVTPAMELTPGQTSTLSFYTAWDVEQGWDGGVIEISTDGGTNWSRLTPTGGYPGTITDGGTLCGIAEGSGAFTGMGHLSWVPYNVDLAAYAGQTVELRWLYRTDAAQVGEGWYVDDVALTHAQIPGMCLVSGDSIFVDGFDAP